MNRRAAILCIILLALVVRLYRADDPFGGFHGFNEAWYAIIARNYFNGSLLMPTSYLGAVDYNVPPLFTYFLYVFYMFFGESEFTSRLVPALFSALAVYFAYRLCGLLYDARAGIAAALLASVVPVSVIVGRNVQVDMTAAAFILAFLYFYVRDRGRGGTASLLPAGLCLGAAVFTKQPSILALAAVVAWEIAATRGAGFLNRRFLVMIAAAVLVPAPFYGYHLAVHPGEFFKAQTGGAASLVEVPGIEAARGLLDEVWWALSPPAAVAALAALASALFRPSRSDLLLMLCIVVFGAFFAFFHKHTYYVLPAALFAVMLCSRLWSGGRAARVRGAALIFAAAASLAVSFSLLAGVKYGWETFARFGAALDSLGASGAVILTDERVKGSFGPLIKYYAPDSETMTFNSLPLDPRGIAAIDYDRGFVLFFDYAFPFAIPEDMKKTIYMDVEGLFLFGFLIHARYRDNRANPHQFAAARLAVKKAAPFHVFGFRRLKSVKIAKFVYLKRPYYIRFVDGGYRVMLGR
ncbi:MAG: glycosyltransferase family 39 protein [bacterium]